MPFGHFQNHPHFQKSFGSPAYYFSVPRKELVVHCPNVLVKQHIGTPICRPVLPVNQIIDTGLDETSCYFADEDGEEVTHGYYWEELSEDYYVVTSQGMYYQVTSQGYYLATDRYRLFQGGDFSYDLSRRKVGEHTDRMIVFRAIEASTSIWCFDAMA